ncbi:MULTISPECIES: hypothetical protein [Chryseobacterium]|uniref:Lipoprotein n=1 Tax=Chryseobacterium vrystaatense TaxID=307480 RepID=A0ABR4UGM4_9FLAO|nr:MULTISPECIES: hypothetical protein [Chryseobacterium]KFF23159.1 hypothetical protein IW16_26315 [Chryseobacterium vrystaatense]MCD0480709.1 hypothetical protein [Chryseobacterium sp. LC2016-29]
MINNRLNFIIFGIVIIFSIIQCKKYDDEIGKSENYFLTENRISDDCMFFQMRFSKGDYILKYSLSGSCKNLKNEVYLRNYSNYVDINYNNLKNKTGYIIIDHYEVANIESFQQEIIRITEKKLGSSVSLFESSENSFTLILSPFTPNNDGHNINR